jgi:hypothetical protein
LRPTEPPIQWVPGIKRPERETDYSPPLRIDVKNIGAAAPLPFTSSRHRDSLTFLLLHFHGVRFLINHSFHEGSLEEALSGIHIVIVDPLHSETSLSRQRIVRQQRPSLVNGWVNMLRINEGIVA